MRYFLIESDGIHWSDGRMAWAETWEDAVRVAKDMVDGQQRISCNIFDIRVSSTTPIGRVALQVARVVEDFRSDL